MRASKHIESHQGMQHGSGCAPGLTDPSGCKSDFHRDACSHFVCWAQVNESQNADLDSNTDMYVCAGLSQYCLCIYLHFSSEQTLLFGTNQVSGTHWWMPRKPCRELQLELSHGDYAETGWNRWPKTFLTWYATASLRLLRCLVLFRCGTCASRVWESAKENMVPKCQASVMKV